MKMNEMDGNASESILFILPVLGQPRHAKRIEMLVKVGFCAVAAAFDRKYHRGRLPGCPVFILGELSHGNYIRRVFSILLGIPRLRKLIKQIQIIYAFGPDMAFLAHCAAFGLRKCIVLEVGDIREAQVADGLSGIFMRFIDRLVTERCCFLVTTAQGFIDQYYRMILNLKGNILLIENKLDFPLPHTNEIVSVRDNPSQVKVRPLRIGYFGLLRCQWTIKVLDALARSKPREVEIVLAGFFLERTDLLSDFITLPNVFYRGEYRSTPEDLEKIYSLVDIVWAAYPYFGSSSHPLVFSLSRSNRFYESCFFKKPMITFEGTGDSAEVLKYGLGFALKDEKISQLIELIYNEVRDNLSTWQRNFSSIPQSLFLYTSEADELKSEIMACMDREFSRATR